MATASEFRQDMPPKGGYPAINYLRAVPKQRFSGWTVIIGGITVMIAGFVGVTKSNRDKR
jgi:NADH dehydrogenase (ubiquinone) 1 alpha subcomplex subunit 13